MTSQVCMVEGRRLRKRKERDVDDFQGAEPVERERGGLLCYAG